MKVAATPTWHRHAETGEPSGADGEMVPPRDVEAIGGIRTSPDF
jgi:hypothetical protein